MTAPEIYERRRQEEYNQAYKQGASDRKNQQPYNPPGQGCLLQHTAYCAGYDEVNAMLKMTFPEDLTIPEIKLLSDDFGINPLWSDGQWFYYCSDLEIESLEEIHEKTGMVCPVSVSGLTEDRFEINFKREEGQSNDKSVQAAA